MFQEKYRRIVVVGPEKVQRITYASSADHTSQPAMFYRADNDEPRPLLVALHSWSSDYQQPQSAIYAEWAIANGWNFIHPNFRGRRKKLLAPNID